jgi:hypothetical protein
LLLQSNILRAWSMGFGECSGASRQESRKIEGLATTSR